MRLRDIQLLLTTYSSALEVNAAGLGGNHVDVRNRDSLRRALAALSSVPSLHDLVAGILRHSVFQSDSSVTSQSEIGALSTNVQQLRGQCDTLRAFLAIELPPAPELYLAVKLPTGASRIDAVEKLLGRLHVAIDHPIRLLGHDPLRVTSAEPGSVVLEVAGVVAAAFGVIGLVLRLGVERAKRDQERIKVESELEKLAQEQQKTQQESLKVQIAALELEKKKLELEAQAHELREQIEMSQIAHTAKDASEAVNAARAAVREIAALHLEGMQFRLQLNAPEEVASVFPAEALPDRYGVEPRQLPAPAKQLGDGTD